MLKAKLDSVKNQGKKKMKGVYLNIYLMIQLLVVALVRTASNCELFTRSFN